MPWKWPTRLIPTVKTPATFHRTFLFLPREFEHVSPPSPEPLFFWFLVDECCLFSRPVLASLSPPFFFGRLFWDIFCEGHTFFHPFRGDSTGGWTFTCESLAEKLRNETGFFNLGLRASAGSWKLKDFVLRFSLLEH